MSIEKIKDFTGYVIPIGNGAVGKTSLSKVMSNFSSKSRTYEDLINSVSKTKNLEFEFIPTTIRISEQPLNIMIQMLIPPGQKEDAGDQNSRSFRQVMEIFKFYIKRVDVILFTYSLVNRESFNDLMFWQNVIKEFVNEATHFILLGTHLDKIDSREVTEDQITKGLVFLENEVKESVPGWKGKCTRLEVSNLTGENFMRLFAYLAGAIYRSRSIMP
jgi:GTPase SAR1 family protein